MSGKIVIDGNIGSGKSTQLKKLAWLTPHKIYQERIDSWPLDDFYRDPRQNALKLQLAVMRSMPRHNGPGIYERCPQTARDVFWDILIQDGTHLPGDQDKFNTEYNKLGWGPDKFIFIDTPPATCIERIQMGRKQPGDDTIDLEYLERLQRQYEVLWDSITCPKVRIDGTQSADDVHREILSHL